MARRGTIFILASAFLAACGGGTAAKPSTDTSASSTIATAGAQAGAAEETPDACAMITPADLAEVFAPRTFVVDASEPVPHIQPVTAQPNPVTSCTFTSGSSIRDRMSITVTLVTAPTDATHASVEQMKRAVTKLRLSATPTDIPGLGDAAYWVNLGIASRSSIAVNVEQAPRRWLTVAESSAGGTIDTTVDRLTAVARKALARL